MRVVDAPDHHPLIARLFDWAALAARRAYEPLFRRLIEDSRFAERALVLGNGARAIINTWHLIELMLEEVARSRCDLHELVTRLQRWITDGGDLPDDRDVQRAETDAVAVRILTVHKAKGLEAPYVFVYGAASPPRASNVHALRDGAGRALFVGPQDEAIERRLAAELDAEHQRLAYVALTRAKLRLYLPRYPDDAIDRKSMYWQIQRCLAPLVPRHAALFEPIAVAMGAPPAPPAPPDALARARTATATAGARARGDRRGTRRARDAELHAARPRLASAAIDPAGRAEPAALHLGPGELPVAIDAAEFDVEVAPITAAPAPDELPPGIDSGLFLHDLFEHVELERIRRTPDADDVARRAKRRRDVRRARTRAWGLACVSRACRATRPRDARQAARDRRARRAAAAGRRRRVRPRGRVRVPDPGRARAGRGASRRTLASGSSPASSTRWSRTATSSGCSTTRATCSSAIQPQVALDHVHAYYSIQQRLYGLAADRLRGGATARRHAVRVRALRRERRAADRRRRGSQSGPIGSRTCARRPRDHAAASTRHVARALRRRGRRRRVSPARARRAPLRSRRRRAVPRRGDRRRRPLVRRLGSRSARHPRARA